MQCSYGKPRQRQKIFATASVPRESVYNLIKPSEVQQKRPARYKSIHSTSTKEFYEAQKLPHRTMGCSKSERPSPKRFLKKHTRETKFDDYQKRNKAAKSGESALFNSPDRIPKKPPVPKHDERPPMLNLTESKDFKKENIRNVIRAAAKKAEPKVIDSPKGHLVILEESGLVPKYCSRKDYGKIPDYLVVMKKDREWSRRRYEKYMREQMEKARPKQISEVQKQDLLAGLKQNWLEMNKKYASIPVMIDTLQKKAHKEGLEQTLKTLEEDMDLLERHDTIYVVDP